MRIKKVADWRGEMDLHDYFIRMSFGDENAFIDLYNELKKPVYTIAYRIVQSKEVAEDITQDVFVKIFVSPPNPTVKNLRAWVFQITHNLSIDHLRKQHNESIDDLQVVSDNETDCILQRIDIEQAMSRLSNQEREIVSLHLNAGLQFHEISKIVKLSMSSTYRKYRKALKILREEMDGDAL